MPLRAPDRSSSTTARRCSCTAPAAGAPTALPSVSSPAPPPRDLKKWCRSTGTAVLHMDIGPQLLTRPPPARPAAGVNGPRPRQVSAAATPCPAPGSRRARRPPPRPSSERAPQPATRGGAAVAANALHRCFLCRCSSSYHTVRVIAHRTAGGNYISPGTANWLNGRAWTRASKCANKRVSYDIF
jgi:hypothetical protein